MGMTQEEKIAVADMVRSHDRFGPVSPEELAALPGKEQELWILLHGLRECGAAAFLQKENSAVYRELLSNASPEARAAALREELKR